MAKKALAVLAMALMLGFGTAAAQASASRSSHSVAGVRATLDEWAKLLLTNQAKAACALLTAHGQAIWAKENSSSNCLVASKADYKFLKQYPTDAKAVKDYGNVQPVTIKGNTAYVPKLAGGDRTLVFVHGLWYINS